MQTWGCSGDESGMNLLERWSQPREGGFYLGINYTVLIQKEIIGKLCVTILIGFYFSIFLGINSTRAITHSPPTIRTSVKR